MPNDQLYISNLYHELHILTYKAVMDANASMREIASIINTRDATYETPYGYLTKGGKAVGRLKPMLQHRPDGPERKLVASTIPESLENEMKRMGVSIRKWAHFYGFNFNSFLANWDKGDCGVLYFEMLHVDFPEYYQVETFDDYSMPTIHPRLDPIKCFHLEGKACFSVTSRNFPEIKLFGENRAMQEKNAKRMHYLIIQRERLRIYCSTDGTSGERIKAVQEWKPEIIEPHNYRIQYELPEWIKFLDNKPILELEIDSLRRQVLTEQDYDRKCQLERELEAKINEFKKSLRMVDSPSFRNAEAQNYWNYYVDGENIQGLERNIIREILDLLDKDGDCPSVVNNNPKEGEREIPRSSYEALAKITLLQHSINVAELLAAEKSSLHLIAHNIITGLGHDLGKLPGIYKFHYKTATHPILSKELLNKMRYFPQYLIKDGILKVIAGHHPKYAPNKSTNHFLEQLVRCDHKAREMELTRVGG